MQKLLKSAAALALCLVLLLQLAGCAQGSGSDLTVDQPVGSGEIADYGQVWSAPSTVKIDRNDTAYANKGAAELSFHTVKNEYESHQLLITATSDIPAYYLESADLTCGDQVLSKDNITVYMEKYVKVAEAAYGSFEMPDALIPIDAALAYGELTAAAGQNAALWVTVYVPAETPAGVYEGTFKLTVGNAAMDIPVQVTVSDYTLPETTTGQTLFSWRYDRVGAGELDSSVEMMQTYYEFFLDYRVSLQSLPVESMTKDELKDAFDNYYDTLTTYTIIPEPGEVPGGATVCNKTKSVILDIAALSAEDGKNYFEKAMLYVVDEPYLQDEEKRNYAIAMCRNVDSMLQECVDTITADTTGVYQAFKAMPNWQDAIRNIPNIMPLVYTSCDYLVEGADTPEVQAFLEAINTICPTFDVYSEQRAEKLIALCAEYGVENIWWYGCTGPIAPYGNYHIGDSNLLDARTYSWVQAKYGIEGNLYWDAAAYTDENSIYYNQFIDVYEAPFRGTHTAWPAGDGFLAYPGAAYGLYGPLPSLRLMSLRDGMEELEMLLALKEQYVELEAAYGEEFSAQGSIDSMVNMVSYDGSKLYADGENGLNFTQVRKGLIDSLVWNEQGIGFALASVSVEGETASISYYVADGCSIYINEEKQTPVKGCRYEYVLDLTASDSLNLVIETADKTRHNVTRFISRPTKILQDFEDAGVLELITLTENSTKELSAGVAGDSNSVHFVVNGKVTGDALTDAAYVPSVSLDTKALSGISSLAEVMLLKMDLFNPTDTVFKVNIKIYSGTSFASAGQYSVDAGKNTFSISIQDISFAAMDQADRIVFEFENSTDGVTANVYDFYLDNMIAAE